MEFREVYFLFFDLAFFFFLWVSGVKWHQLGYYRLLRGLGAGKARPEP